MAGETLEAEVNNDSDAFALGMEGPNKLELLMYSLLKQTPLGTKGASAARTGSWKQACIQQRSNQTSFHLAKNSRASFPHECIVEFVGPEPIIHDNAGRDDVGVKLGM